MNEEGPGRGKFGNPIGDVSRFGIVRADEIMQLNHLHELHERGNGNWREVKSFDLVPERLRK